MQFETGRDDCSLVVSVMTQGERVQKFGLSELRINIRVGIQTLVRVGVRVSLRVRISLRVGVS